MEIVGEQGTEGATVFGRLITAGRNGIKPAENETASRERGRKRGRNSRKNSRSRGTEDAPTESGKEADGDEV